METANRTNMTHVENGLECCYRIKTKERERERERERDRQKCLKREKHPQRKAVITASRRKLQAEIISHTRLSAKKNQVHAIFLYLCKFLGIEEILAENRSSETCVKCNLCRVGQQIGCEIQWRRENVWRIVTDPRANCTIDN